MVESRRSRSLGVAVVLVSLSGCSRTIVGSGAGDEQATGPENDEGATSAGDEGGVDDGDEGGVDDGEASGDAGESTSGDEDGGLDGPTPDGLRLVVYRLDFVGDVLQETELLSFPVDGAFDGESMLSGDLDGDGWLDVWLPQTSLVIRGPLSPQAEVVQTPGGMGPSAYDPPWGALELINVDIDAVPGEELIFGGANVQLTAIGFDMASPSRKATLARYAEQFSPASVAGQRGMLLLVQWPTAALEFEPLDASFAFASPVAFSLAPQQAGVDVRFAHGVTTSPDGTQAWVLVSPRQPNQGSADLTPQLHRVPLDGSAATKSLFPTGPADGGIWDPRAVFLDLVDSRKELLWREGGDGSSKKFVWASISKTEFEVHEQISGGVADRIGDCVEHASATDLDGDGVRDFYFPCESQAQAPSISVAWSDTPSGPVSFGQTKHYALPAASSSNQWFSETYPPFPTDVDGDGRDELIWIRVESTP